MMSILLLVFSHILGLVEICLSYGAIFICSICIFQDIANLLYGSKRKKIS